LAQILLSLLRGFFDAIALHRCVIFFRKSDIVRRRSLWCFLLNGVFFLGVITLFNRVTIPVFNVVASLAVAANLAGAWLPGFVDKCCWVFFRYVLCYPLYIVSLILNTLWYQEIAEHSYHCIPLQKRRTTGSSTVKKGLSSKIDSSKWLRSATEGVIRVLLTYVWWVETLLVAPIPVIGPLVYWPSFAWLMAYYSFEYRWQYLGYSTLDRIYEIETNWPYYLGFGAPYCIIAALCPQFIDWGVLAFIFPLSILTSIRASPVRTSDTRRNIVSVVRLPIFALPQAVTRFVLESTDRFTTRLKESTE